MIRVLFLCTGNSCRSQMAEGWSKAMHQDVMEAHSAGTAPTALDPLAVLAMSESGVDISQQRSKSIAELVDGSGQPLLFDYVVTVCSQAHETCPVFPGPARVLHQGFDDPPLLARSAVSVEEGFQYYRKVRDEIRAFIERLPDVLAVELPSSNAEGGSRS